MKFILVVLSALFMTSVSQAQDFGILGGIHNTEPDVPGASSTDAELGFKAGFVVSNEIASNVKFRSGVLYTTRYFNAASPGLDVDFKFAYVDVPVLFQMNLNETVGFYAGPVVAINVDDKFEVGSSSGTVDDMKDIYLLGELGLNFTFDMIGFDVYYQMGFGEIYDDGAEDYATYGANFIYWF